MAEGDAAGITLSKPLFYSQWIFTDVDQPDEGFNVNPRWTEVGEAAAFGGDDNFTFVGSTTDSVELDDTDGNGTASEAIEGRVQVDFLGAVTGIDITRTFPSNGQSGFAVGGGCEATGTAKRVIDGPTWNGTSFDAQAAVGSSFLTDTPQGIPLNNLQLTDDLSDPAFSAITVTDISATGTLLANQNYNGLNDINLLLPGSSLDAETEATVTLSVSYTPELSQATWTECANGYPYENQSIISGTAANVAFEDASDNGPDPAPAADNGEGGVDDPTPVLPSFLVQTEPSFANGVPGDGPALAVEERQTVTYCVSVLNDGIGTARNVVVSDPQGPGDFTIADLGSGQTADVSYDVVVALDTPPVNTATATGTDALGSLGPVSDTAVIQPTAIPEPGLEIVKTVVAGPNGTCPSFEQGTIGEGTPLNVLFGDTVTYCISVRNVGPGIATNAPQDFVIGTLTPGQGATESYDIAITATTPERNVATANGDGPNGAVPPVSDPALINPSPIPEPNLEIVKTVLPGPDGICPAFADGVSGLGDALVVDNGDTVTYCISVRNNGPGVATQVVVSDDQAPGDADFGTLAAGQEGTTSYDIVVDANTPTVNTAVVNGNGPTGRCPKHRIQLRSHNGIQGLGDPVFFVETEVVTYCVTVINTGSATATNVVITDDQAPNTFDLEVGTLAPGAQATRSYDLQVFQSTPEVNTAFVNGDGPNGSLPEMNDPAQIRVDLQPDPVLEIVKTVVADALPVLYTDVVTFCITVTNTGENPATSVTVSDDQAPGVLQIGTVQVGEEVSESYDVTVDAATPERNTATVNGQGPNGDLPSDSDTALIDPSPQPDPVLEIVKTAIAGPQGCVPGVRRWHCWRRRRTPSSCSIRDRLAVDAVETRSYDVVVDASTPSLNVATVDGEGPNGELPPKSDPALIDPAPQLDPVLDIVKTVVPGPEGECPSFADGVPGDGPALPVMYTEVVTYCITVTNTSGNPATNVMITDPQGPGAFDIGDLAVGQEATVSYDIEITAATLTLNTATATGTGPNGDLDPVSDTAIPLPDPVLEIVKTVVPGPQGDCPAFADGVQGRGDALEVEIGDTVTYCIAIINSGAGDAENVKITDDQATPSQFEIGALAAGAETGVSYDIVIDEETAFINVAAVTGTGPNGPVPQDDDDAAIDVTDNRLARVELIHSVAKASDDECLTVAKDLNSLAADIAGTGVITNTGNVPLTDVELNAGSIGIVDADALAAVGAGTVLLPGDSVSLSVGGASIPVNGLTSVGVVTAEPSDEEGNLLTLDTVTDTDDAEVREAAINLETTVVAGVDGDCVNGAELITVAVGSDVTWCFEVTNTGTVSLLVEEVTDITLGLTVPIPEDEQAPGDLTNDAAVVGQPLDTDGSILDQAPVVEDADPAAIDTREADLAIVKTVSNPGPVPAGTVLTYTLVITNNGPNEAVGVEVEDLLPSGLTYMALPGQDGWACSLAGAQGFTCLKATDMANGDVATLTYTVRVDETAALAVDLLNTATVDAETPDTDESNNTDDHGTKHP
ncbi:hypothetical protein GQR58_030580 [Nymphon striatum]|nr:hypothetical protein GQR58_030580 [Nymphon striatum]